MLIRLLILSAFVLLVQLVAGLFARDAHHTNDKAGVGTHFQGRRVLSKSPASLELSPRLARGSAKDDVPGTLTRRRQQLQRFNKRATVASQKSTRSHHQASDEREIFRAEESSYTANVSLDTRGSKESTLLSRIKLPGDPLSVNQTDKDSVSIVAVKDETHDQSEKSEEDISAKDNTSVAVVASSMAGTTEESLTIVSRKRRPVVHRSTETSPASTASQLPVAAALTMSDSLYNHFSPLDKDVPEDHILPFLHFGKKLAPSTKTTHPTIHASVTGSTNSLDSVTNSPKQRGALAPPMDPLFNVNLHNIPRPPSEEEIHEDMDVSVMKSVIEKNKVARGKGSSLLSLRTVGGLYRKQPDMMENLVTYSDKNSANVTGNKGNDTKDPERKRTLSISPGKKNMDVLVDSNGRRKLVTVSRRPLATSSTTSGIPVNAAADTSATKEGTTDYQEQSDNSETSYEKLTVASLPETKPTLASIDEETIITLVRSSATSGPSPTALVPTQEFGSSSHVHASVVTPYAHRELFARQQATKNHTAFITRRRPPQLYYSMIRKNNTSILVPPVVSQRDIVTKQSNDFHDSNASSAANPSGVDEIPLMISMSSTTEYFKPLSSRSPSIIEKYQRMRMAEARRHSMQNDSGNLRPSRRGEQNESSIDSKVDNLKSESIIRHSNTSDTIQEQTLDRDPPTSVSSTNIPLIRNDLLRNFHSVTSSSRNTTPTTTIRTAFQLSPTTEQPPNTSVFPPPTTKILSTAVVTSVSVQGTWETDITVMPPQEVFPIRPQLEETAPNLNVDRSIVSSHVPVAMVRPLELSLNNETSGNASAAGTSYDLMTHPLDSQSAEKSNTARTVKSPSTSPGSSSYSMIKDHIPEINNGSETESASIDNINLPSVDTTSKSQAPPKITYSTISSTPMANTYSDTTEPPISPVFSNSGVYYTSSHRSNSVLNSSTMSPASSITTAKNGDPLYTTIPISSSSPSIMFTTNVTVATTQRSTTTQQTSPTFSNPTSSTEQSDEIDIPIPMVLLPSTTTTQQNNASTEESTNKGRALWGNSTTKPSTNIPILHSSDKDFDLPLVKLYNSSTVWGDSPKPTEVTFQNKSELGKEVVSVNRTASVIGQPNLVAENVSTGDQGEPSMSLHTSPSISVIEDEEGCEGGDSLPEKCNGRPNNTSTEHPEGDSMTEAMGACRGSNATLGCTPSPVVPLRDVRNDTDSHGCGGLNITLDGCVPRPREGSVGIAMSTSGIEMAIYVLAGICIIPIIIAMVFVVRCLLKRSRKFLDESDTYSEISCHRTGRGAGERAGSAPPSTKLPRLQAHLGWEQEKSPTPPAIVPDPNSRWEFPRSKLRLQTVLGQGNFGQVLKAEADDLSGHNGTTRLVAVKMLKETATTRERDDLLRELDIMKELGSHPNVVTLLGCCTEQEPYLLIMEYVMYGKLLAFLRDHRTRQHYYNFSEDSDALTSRDLTVFGYCVARGMEYLGSKGIIHRDLAARNVLVDHNKLCKIADFGMSRTVRELGEVYEQRQTKGALPIRWMAPESLHYRVFTHKSDVWSFGILMWELVTLGSTPYPSMGAREVMRRVRDGYRLERPSHCRPELFRVISRCWSADPTKRPEFSELKRELGTLVEDARQGGYVDLDHFAEYNNGRHYLSAPTANLGQHSGGELEVMSM